MKKKVIKPFSISAARAGSVVETREGCKVRIICFDKKGDFPIVALLECDDVKEHVYTYRTNGKWCTDNNVEYKHDLVIVEYIDEPCSFKPFDKVLVRDYKSDFWKPKFFSHYREGDSHPFITMYGNYKYCIPYEGNEDLCFTDKNPE